MTSNTSIISNQKAISPNTYYVYGLVDPINEEIFYIGKGIGNRAKQHLTKSHNTLVRNRVASIKANNQKVIIQILFDQLTVENALRIEAHMISFYRLSSSGGSLLNSVSPSGRVKKPNKKFITLQCTKNKAQAAFKTLEEAVVEFLEANPGGARNCDIAQCLGLQTTYKDGAKDYLTWSILGELVKKAKVVRASNSTSYNIP